jgi:hypothetical protein
MADLAMTAGLGAASLAANYFLPGAGLLVGPAAKLFGVGVRRAPTISQARISGNAFAQGCVRFGVGSSQCPVGELQGWADRSRTRYPNAYAQVFAPLLARRPVQLGYLQNLATRYLAPRARARGAAAAAQRLGVTLPGVRSPGFRSLAATGLRL